MTRRIQEHDLASVCGRIFILHGNFVSANVLRNSARLAFRNTGRTDRIEQRRFAVVHVTHDRDHWWAWHAFGSRTFFTGGGFGDFLCRLLFKTNDICFCAEKARHLAGKLGVKSLVDSRKYAFGE